MAPIESYITDEEKEELGLGTQEEFSKETSSTSQPSTPRTIVNAENTSPHAPKVDIPPEEDIFSDIDEIMKASNYLLKMNQPENRPVQIPQQQSPQPDPLGAIVKKTILNSQPDSQPGILHQQPDPVKPSTSRTLETITIQELLKPQPDSQPGQFHQQPVSASTSSSNDQGDHVVRGNEQWIIFEQNHPMVLITNQPKSVQRVRYMTID